MYPKILSQTLHQEDNGNIVLKCWEKINLSTQISCLIKIVFKKETKIKIFLIQGERRNHKGNGNLFWNEW